VVADDFNGRMAASGGSATPAPNTPAILGPVRGAAEITAGSAAPETLGVHADEPGTLVVELARPTPYFLSVLTHPATFSDPSRLPGGARPGLRETRRDGVERRLRLDTLGFRFASRGGAQCQVLERCRHPTG